MFQFIPLVILSLRLTLSADAESNRFPDDCTRIRPIPGLPGLEAHCWNANHTQRGYTAADLSGCMGVEPNGQLLCGQGKLDYQLGCRQCRTEVVHNDTVMRCSCRNAEGHYIDTQTPLGKCVSVDADGNLKPNGTRVVDQKASYKGYFEKCHARLLLDTGLIAGECMLNGSLFASLFDLNNCIGGNAEGELVRG
ncbi:hypothetical protein C8R43DRAFT_1124589 [Mycena crocata]|nr:hypothetical protein C8R43DRAFT_1124589 [Mycena crocata]